MDDEFIGIEAEFWESWEALELMLAEKTADQTPSISDADSDYLAIVRELRSLGYDQWFRASTSLTHFILARSKTLGLTPSQSFMLLDFGVTGTLSVYALIGKTEYRLKLTSTKLGNEVIALLDLLMTQPIE